MKNCQNKKLIIALSSGLEPQLGLQGLSKPQASGLKSSCFDDMQCLRGTQSLDM